MKLVKKNQKEKLIQIQKEIEEKLKKNEELEEIDKFHLKNLSKNMSLLK